MPCKGLPAPEPGALPVSLAELAAAKGDWNAGLRGSPKGCYVLARMRKVGRQQCWTKKVLPEQQLPVSRSLADPPKGQTQSSATVWCQSAGLFVRAHLGAVGADVALSCLAALAAAKGFTAAGTGRLRGFRAPPPPSLAAESCSLPLAGGGAAPGLLVVEPPLAPSPLTLETLAETAAAVGPAAAAAAGGGAAASVGLLCSDTVAMLGALLLGAPAQPRRHQSHH